VKFFDLARLHDFFTKFNEYGTRAQQAETNFILRYSYKMFKLCFTTMLTVYFLGIMMYIVSKDCNPNTEFSHTFIGKYNLHELSNYEIIIRCMYFILTTVTTIGYGDFIPISQNERAFIMFIELIGVAFFSYILGNFIDMISAYDKKMSDTDKNLELNVWLNFLARFNQGKSINPELLHEIADHFKYFWQEYRLDNINPENKFLKSFPETTQHAVFFHYVKNYKKDDNNTFI